MVFYLEFLGQLNFVRFQTQFTTQNSADFELSQPTFIGLSLSELVDLNLFFHYEYSFR